MLWLTGTTLNIQSFIGAIMAVGVAVANAILLVTFAERHRREEGPTRPRRPSTGAEGRLRPILMTSCAMMAGMLPMALGWGEGGEQTAPLGRAVIGGLAAATLATLSCCRPSSRWSRAGRAGNRPRSTPTTRRARTTTRRSDEELRRPGRRPTASRMRPQSRWPSAGLESPARATSEPSR